MRPWILVLLSLAVVPAAAGAQAAPRAPAPAWALITRTRQLTWYVDTARVATAGPEATVWLRYDTPAPQPLPSNPLRHYSRVEVQERLNCGAMRVADLQMRLLDPAGRLIDQLPVRREPRIFSRHPLGQLMVITCNILEARRRGMLKAMIERLQQAPVPGRY